MIISDLEHIEVVSQETKETQVIRGSGFAGAQAGAGGVATGPQSFVITRSDTFTKAGSYSFPAYPPYK